MIYCRSMVVSGPAPFVGQIDLANEPDFNLGEMSVKPSERVVEVAGERRELQPRVMQVLVALARARPSVVSRDRLVEQCWDGRVVGDDALNRCILALRHLAGEISPHPFVIETVPRIGHRLVETGAKPTALREPAAAAPKPGTWRLVVALLAVVVVAASLFLWQQRPAQAEPVSIAMLPFRNFSNADSHFAQGIGEEILGQLAREPQFRITGSSSSTQFTSDADVRDVARRLNVDYILEGSVRRQGDQVRVDAALIRARDRTRLWSDSYDGKLDDIFAIQRRIGAAIASALRRRLVRAPALSGPLVTKGEAYGLYLTARSLIRTRNRRAGPTATDLLRDAIRIDPGYAPAWASLAEATGMEGALGDREAFITAIRKARGYARHALSLAPHMAEAHRALGRTFGYGDPQGLAHLSRASVLGPNNAENLIDLGTARAASGDFEGELAAYRQASQLDPLWFRTTGVTAIAVAETGDRAEAEAIAGGGLPDNNANLQILLGRIAWIFADYSEAVRRWNIGARSNSPRWSAPAKRALNDATHAVGITTGPLIDVPEPPAGRSNWRVWMDAPPSPAVWKARNRDAIAASVYRKHNLVAAKLMINVGRWSELVATYDSVIGFQGLRPGGQPRVDQLSEAPIVALALRAGARADEADHLLREAASLSRTVSWKSKVPFWFDAQSAAIYAALGKQDEALAALQRAFERGWRQSDGADLRDIADEPAFRSLHGDPRFERLRVRIAAHYAREREETINLRI